MQFDGFKACFGGEELKRACATLSGALISGKLPVRLSCCSRDTESSRDIAGGSSSNVQQQDIAAGGVLRNAYAVWHTLLCTILYSRNELFHAQAADVLKLVFKARAADSSAPMSNKHSCQRCVCVHLAAGGTQHRAQLYHDLPRLFKTPL
jgi:hypothetical protein